MGADTLEIRLLGELELVRDGRAIVLPASRKTRALLAYLVATGRPTLRTRLCEIFWDGPDDPRAQLRWSLTKIRPLLDEVGVPRLVADRERVAFRAEGATSDLDAVRAVMIGAASTEALAVAAARFRGELLEGLDLPDCYRWHAWVVAEREAVRALRGEILAALVERLRAQPEEALRHARVRVGIDPLHEAAHVEVVRLLGELGRTREALRQYEEWQRLADTELKSKPSAEMERARTALGKAAAATGATGSAGAGTATAAGAGADGNAVAAAATGAPAETGLVGRAFEVEAIDRAVRDPASREALLFVGEPGIGKSRLLEEVVARVRAAGGLVLRGRAFEAEMVRPYGAWIDALRSVELGELGAAGEAQRADLAALLPELGPAAPAGDRNRLFDAVAQLLGARGRSGRPVAVVLDDLHWFDEASAALLHYVVRAPAAAGTLVACGARPGELGDNPAALRVVRALGREHRLRQVPLAPLDAAEITALVRSVAPGLEPRVVFDESEGNPLFALEIARALREGAAAQETLPALLEDRVARLDERARDVVPWAAALGRSFGLDLLVRVTAVPTPDLLAALEELERRGILRAAAGGGAPGYDFTHDLLRRAAYRRLSEPRRRLVHASIARAIAALPDSDGALAGDVAHHAALGGEAELAVRACVAAGERALRLHAWSEADELSRRGLAHLPALAHVPRIASHVRLIRILVDARRGHRIVRELETELSRLILEAQSAGLNAEVATGFYALSVLHHRRGDDDSALEDTLRAADAGRAADPVTALRSLANSGRCLAQLEREMGKAQALLLEVEAAASSRALQLPNVPWGLGLIAQYEGRADEAVPMLERGAAWAAQQQDAWAECECRTALVTVELERGQPAAALERHPPLLAAAARMGDGSELPFAVALGALARHALHEAGATAELERSIGVLRAIDSRLLVAYVQNVAAEIDVAAGRRGEARRRAEEALRSAEVVGRRTEIALARAMLARLALGDGTREPAEAYLDAVRGDLAARGLSARAAAAVTAVARALEGAAAPAATTGAPTPRG